MCIGAPFCILAKVPPWPRLVAPVPTGCAAPDHLIKCTVLCTMTVCFGGFVCMRHCLALAADLGQFPAITAHGGKHASDCTTHVAIFVVCAVASSRSGGASVVAKSLRPLLMSALIRVYIADSLQTALMERDVAALLLDGPFPAQTRAVPLIVIATMRCRWT